MTKHAVCEGLELFRGALGRLGAPYDIIAEAEEIRAKSILILSRCDKLSNVWAKCRCEAEMPRARFVAQSNRKVGESWRQNRGAASLATLPLLTSEQQWLENQNLEQQKKSPLLLQQKYMFL